MSVVAAGWMLLEDVNACISLQKFVTLHHLQCVGGSHDGFLFLLSYMIDKNLLTQTVLDAIEGTEMFLVDVAISRSNEIVVEIDSADGIDIDTCASITRKIESVFDREVEDYQLEVGSAGLTSPFKVRGQYLKNIGNEVEVLTKDGRKLHGVLESVADDDSFVVAVPTKVKVEGAKRPVVQDVEHTFSPDECKSVKYVINFK